MSPKNFPLIVGLAAPGLFWLATSVAIGQDLPPVPPGPMTPVPTPSSPISKSYQALLLSNGKVVRGDIVEDTSAGLYQLRQRGGSIGYPKIMVQKAGESLDELYRFQAVRLPDGDPDERMKLARWCLTEKLTDQAREQLEAVRAMCPNDAEARRMLFNLGTTVDRSNLDPAVGRTSVDLPRGDAPATLDPRVISRAQKRFNALPEIFDLPQAQAVKRANEFADYVQPVLQQSCAKCHNEKYQGDFQLVEVKIRRDQTNSDIARANLDATLRLITPDDLSRSPLLTAGLVPHGGSKNAVFRGPNDRSYQVLATWARSLKASTKGPGTGNQAGTRNAGDGVTRTGFTPSDPSADGQGFASERGSRQAATTGSPAVAEKNEFRSVTPPPRAIVEQINESAEFITAPGDKPVFELPYAAGAKTAPKPVPPRAKAGAGSKPTTPGSASAATTNPKAPAPSTKTATPSGPGTVIVATDNPNELPGMDQPRYPPKKADAEADDAPAGSKKAKPIDPALLEKMIRLRNGGTP